VHLAERDGFHLADASVSKKINACVDLTGGVRNLFNVTQINNTSRQSGAHATGPTIPVGYGRSYFVTISLHWQK
jgi:outer membrane receptor for ferrienterochelin and colicins